MNSRQQFPFTINTILKNNQPPPNNFDFHQKSLLSSKNGCQPSNDPYTVFYSSPPPKDIFNFQQHLFKEQQRRKQNQFLASATATTTNLNKNFVESFENFMTSQPPPTKEKRAGHPYQSRAPPRHKKPRTSFTKNQVGYLENRFLDQKYLASAERAKLANQLNMSDAQVKTWFQNRRTKWRRQEAEEREYTTRTTSKLLSMTAQCLFQRKDDY